ncbi:MAG: integration host factor subunit beta [Proteobacteria bacterium]|nr:integration host factor subunit beta [Pseudomonadota bacterium]
MTKRDIARRMGNDSCRVKNVKINDVLLAIKEQLHYCGRLELRGFGVFEVVERKERKARNPKTGEVVMVSARWDVRFKPSANLVAYLNTTIGG